MTTKTAMATAPEDTPKPMTIGNDLLTAMRRPAPEPAPPADATPPGEFSVINPLWRNPLDDLACELADLPDGRRLARRVLTGGHGKPCLLYWEIDRHEPDKRPVPLNNLEDELARPHQMLDQLAGSSPGGNPGRIERSPLESEVERFAATYPHIAHHLKLVGLAPHRQFDPGPCYRPIIGPSWPKYDLAKTGEIDWAQFRDRHVSGNDFGIHGALADAPPLDPVTLWTIGLQPTLIRNAHSLQSRLGAVRSDFEYTGPKGHKITITAITALMRDPHKTFTVFHVRVPQH